MKVKIKKTMNNGAIEYIDIYSKDTEVRGKNTSSGQESKFFISSTWYKQSNNEQVDDELDTFIRNTLKGGLYEHPDYKFEIVSQSET